MQSVLLSVDSDMEICSRWRFGVVDDDGEESRHLRFGSHDRSEWWCLAERAFVSIALDRERDQNTRDSYRENTLWMYDAQCTGCDGDVPSRSGRVMVRCTGSRLEWHLFFDNGAQLPVAATGAQLQGPAGGNSKSRPEVAGSGRTQRSACRV